MNKAQKIGAYVLVGILVVGLSGWAGFVRVTTAGSCGLAEVQLQIIADERPQMGQLEKEFWQKAIAAASEKAGIGNYADVMTAKIAHESNFDRFRVSTAGAKCAAQIMPTHYKRDSEIGEIESCLDLGAKIWATELKNCETAVRALRCYYAGPTNSKKGTLRFANGYDLGKYSDGILARVYVAEKNCKAKLDSKNR